MITRVEGSKSEAGGGQRAEAEILRSLDCNRGAAWIVKVLNKAPNNLAGRRNTDVERDYQRVSSHQRL